MPAFLQCRADALHPSIRVALARTGRCRLEVLEFGWRSQARCLESLGATVTPRTVYAGPYRTDQRNIILDSRFGPIIDPVGLAGTLGARAGLVGHGLFIGIASDVTVSGEAGMRHLRRGRAAVPEG